MARGAERRASKMFRKYVEFQGERPESLIDRLFYDQYRANEEAQLYHLNEMRMRDQDKKHDKRYMARRQREQDIIREKERKEDREAEDRRSAILNEHIEEITQLLKISVMGGSGGGCSPPDPGYDSGYGSRASSRQR
jgi:hypothetical protein